MPAAGPARTVRTARTEEHGSFHAHSTDAVVGFALLRRPGHPAGGAHRGRARLDRGAAGRNLVFYLAWPAYAARLPPGFTWSVRPSGIATVLLLNLLLLVTSPLLRGEPVLVT